MQISDWSHPYVVVEVRSTHVWSYLSIHFCGRCRTVVSDPLLLDLQWPTNTAMARFYGLPKTWYFPKTNCGTVWHSHIWISKMTFGTTQTTHARITHECQLYRNVSQQTWLLQITTDCSILSSDPFDFINLVRRRTFVLNKNVLR